jgi:hypothetical protein
MMCDNVNDTRYGMRIDMVTTLPRVFAGCS